MPSWSDSMERQLLLHVIQTCSVASPDWDKISDLMGDGFTASAVRQRFNKMKKDAKEGSGDSGEETKGSTPKGKPKAKATNATAKKGPGKRKGKDEAEAEADDDEVADAESPKKKAKVKAEVKGEGQEDEGDIF